MKATRLQITATGLTLRFYSTLIVVAIWWPSLNYFYSARASTLEQTPSPTSQPPTNNSSPATPAPPSTESQLVEGLLDLLEDEPPAPMTQQDPLVLVQQLMQQASNVLRSNHSVQQASRLQMQVVSQLDALIGQLQQSQSKPNSSRDQTNVNQQEDIFVQEAMSQLDKTTEFDRKRQNELNSQDSSGEPVNNSNDNDPTSPPEAPSDRAGEGASNNPGDAGRGALPPVQLNSPSDLQQSVWGHLPEQVRTQMQSRMVEEFLPSYRQQLEAYYRSLLNKGLKR